MRNDNFTEADLWLKFGSFAYGFEALVEGFERNALTLSLKEVDALPQSRDGRFTALQFFESLQKRKAAKALLTTEVRLFASRSNTHTPAVRTLEERVCLLSPLLPLPQESKNPAIDLRLIVRNLSPAGAQDAEMWHELTTHVWPHMVE